LPNFDLHTLTAVAQLPAYPVPGYTIPAKPGEVFSEQTLYSTGFEVGVGGGGADVFHAAEVLATDTIPGSDAGGWTALSGPALATATTNTRSTPRALYVAGTTAGIYGKTFSGFVVGRDYIISAWFRPASATATFGVGVQRSPGQYEYSTPTASAADLYTERTVAITASQTTQTVIFVTNGQVRVDDFTITKAAWTETFPPDYKDGFVAGTNSAVYDATDKKHSGSRSLTVGRTSLAAGQVQAKRTLTGLTVGRAYTVTGWASNPYDEGIDQFKIGITGKGYGTAVDPYETWMQATYKFTATATSHELLLEHRRPTDSVYVSSTYGYWDDIKVVRDAYSTAVSETVVPAGMAPAGPLTLKVKSASISLDETAVPYVSIALTCAMPSIPQAEAFNPLLAAPIRVVVTATQQFGDANGNWNAEGYRAPGTRAFNVVLRSAKVDRETQELSLVLMSDEARLIDRALVSPTPDYTPLTLQSSLRGITNYVLGKIGASLAAGEDTNVTVSQSPNLFIKPSGRRGGSTNSGLLSLAASGIGQDPGTDTYAVVNPGTATGGAGLYMAEIINVGEKLAPFTTYTYSATIYGSATPALLYVGGTGIPAGGQAGASVPAGAFTRTSLTFTTGATGYVTFYVLNGATIPASGTSYIAIQDAQLEKGTYASPYFDGNKAADALYTYAWSGVADASTSTRTLKTPRSEDLLNWMPGVAAWDFLSPIVQATGFRLWCDEAGVWRLAKTWAQGNQINVSPTNGVKRASDSRTRNDGNYWQSVVVKYSWTDAAGLNRTAYDSAGSGDLVWFIEKDSPYPGAGAASYLLSRSMGRGRVLDLQSTSNYAATPGSVLIVTLPDTPIQSGVVSAVTWSFPSGDMTITSKGLTDTPSNAWVVAPDGRTWNTATGTWNTYTN
jgi:hypothetical protein